MGSIGVSTGDIRSSELGKALEGSKLLLGRDAKTIVVFPNNVDNKMTDRARGRYRGFAISMGNADTAQRDAFLTKLKGQANVSARNADAAYNRAVQDAKNSGMSAREQRIVGEMARTAVQRRAIQAMLDKDKSGKYGGIKLRNLTNADYKRLK